MLNARELRYSMNRTTTCSYAAGLHPDPPPRRGDGAEEGTRTRGVMEYHNRLGFKRAVLNEVARVLQVPSSVPLLARRRVRVEAGSCRS